MERNRRGLIPVEQTIDGLRLILLREPGRHDRLRIVRPNQQRIVARWTRAGLAVQWTDEDRWFRGVRTPWVVEDGEEFSYPTTLYGLFVDAIGSGPGVSYGALVDTLVWLRRAEQLTGFSVELSFPDGKVHMAVRPTGSSRSPWRQLEVPNTLGRLCRWLRHDVVDPRRSGPFEPVLVEFLS